MFDELLSCVTGSWSPTIGDPSIMGWVTVFAYFVAASLAALVLIRGAANRRAFWYFLTIALVLLAVNKQLDLQSGMTAIGRCMAKLQGWYDQRRAVQVTFILVLSVLSLIVTLMVAWNMRRGGLARIWLAFFGFVLLVTFVVVRAAGFHDFDRFIGLELSGIRMNWLLELTGIVMIALNAVLLIRRGSAPAMRRKRRKRIENDLPLRRDHL